MPLTDTININVASYNCQGLKPRNYDFMKLLFRDFNLLLIQEHWLYVSEFKKITTLLPNSSCHAVSSMDERILRAGRPYGGTAIIYRNNINAQFIPVQTPTPRLCAVKIESPNIRLIVISVYMPVDNPEYLIEFNDILHQLSCLYNQYPDHQMIVGADFNCDRTRDNARGRRLLEWRAGLSLVSPALEPDAPRRPTYYSPDGGSAVLDYVFLSEGILGDMTSWSVIDSGENLSDHNPTVVKLSTTLHSIEEEKDRTRLPNWRKATNENIDSYKRNLDIALSDIDIPEAALLCENLNCADHKEDIECLLKSITDACKSAASLSLPLSAAPGGRGGVPGWNASVRDARDTAMWWHERWKENGRPREGWVAVIRRNTRAKYHLAVKKCKSEKDKNIRIATSNIIESSSPQKFWSHVSKLNRHKPLVCSVIDGHTGDDAVNAFKDKFSNIYNSNPSTNIPNLTSKISREIQNCCCGNRNGDKINHLHTITAPMVSNALKKLKRNQYDSQSQIFSDSLIHGTDKLFFLIQILFTQIIRHGFHCDILTTTTIKPIPKNKKKSMSV